MMTPPHSVQEDPRDRIEIFLVHIILHTWRVPMTPSLPSPLGGPAPKERPLVNSPLARVLVQARFAGILKIDSKEGVAPFQELIRQRYPLLEQVTAHGLQMEVTANTPNFRQIASNVWRFSDADESFVVSLTSDAITLEARRYPGRKAFMERWSELLKSIQDIYAPSLAVRVGIRYFNRINGDAMNHLPTWVKPNLIGVALPEYRKYVKQAISEANMQIDEGNMLLRWGVIPKNSTIDPNLIDPVKTASWLLDIDASSSKQCPFDADSLTAAYQKLSERAYAVFRWVMTDDGLAYFERV